MTGERRVVIEHRKELTYLLSQGAELEHGFMCQYLYAAFSLKRQPGPGIGQDQLEATEQWRSVIMGIAREEMLHWAMVQNLLTAVGSAPFVSRPHMPHQAKGLPADIQLRLLPFGEEALRHFVYIERPQDMELSDSYIFNNEGPSLAPMQTEEIMPRGQDYSTLGELYRSIEAGLIDLTRSLGETGLFIGPAYHQANEETFAWPDLTPIVDLDGAIRALQRIVEHGEGARGNWKTAHFGRFLLILEEYESMRREDPGFEPAYPVVAAASRAVEDVEPDFYITNRTTGLISDLFNAVYELLLQMIARYFAFGSESAEQRALLADAAVRLMFEAINPLGPLLAQLEVGPEYPGVTAGASFQLPYRASFLLPHGRSSWIRYVERLEELSAFAGAIGPFEGQEIVDSVGVALKNLSAELGAQIAQVDDR